jgi:uncharacterized protein YjbI with pentapeptide repeats
LAFFSGNMALCYINITNIKITNINITNINITNIKITNIKITNIIITNINITNIIITNITITNINTTNINITNINITNIKITNINITKTKCGFNKSWEVTWMAMRLLDFKEGFWLMALNIYLVLLSYAFGLKFYFINFFDCEAYLIVFSSSYLTENTKHVYHKVNYTDDIRRDYCCLF